MIGRSQAEAATGPASGRNPQPAARPGAVAARPALSILLLLVCAAGIFIQRWDTFHVVCMSPDERLTATIAEEISAGRMAHRDVWINHPTGLYSLVALMGRSLGQRAIAVLAPLRVVWTVLVCWIMVLVLRFAKTIGDDRAGWAAAVLFSFLGTATRYEFAECNHETLSAALIWSAFALWLGRSAARAWTALLCGLLVGAALWIKIDALTAVATLASVTLLGLVRARDPGARRLHLARALGFAAGVLAVLASGVLWHLRAGALPALWEQVVGSNFLYAGSLPPEVRLKCLASLVSQTLLRQQVLWGLAAAGVIAFVAERSRRPWLAEPPDRRMIALEWVVIYLVVTSVVISLGGRFFDHYLILILPPAAILAGVAFARASRSGGRWARVALTSVLAVALGIAFVHRMSHRIPRLGPPYAEVGARVARLVSPQQRIFVWGGEPGVYLAARRGPATPFVWCHPLTGFDPDRTGRRRSAEAARGNIREGTWAELMRALRDAKPRVIVDMATAESDPYASFPISAYPQLREFVDRYYVPVDRVEGMTIYRLAKPADG